MTTTDEWTAGRLVELSETECWQLIATHLVGRLAWVGPAGISVIPMNYVSNEDGVQLQTHAYSAMVREVDGSPVAFEVDEVDEVSRSGWSVLVRGTAHISYDHADTSSERPDVWPSGSKALPIKVVVKSVTGRRVLPS
jgi:nitroimidazol reductase NimA-like FMN-containing flavoprotein (pyridoxamine 5'-phosphate oxidase superfamily)